MSQITLVVWTLLKQHGLKLTNVTFLCRSSATSDDQIKGSVENVNTRRSIFLSLFKVESHPYKFSSWTICHI